MQLSKHFSLAEMVASGTAKQRRINNYASPAVIENLRTLCALMEQVRYVLGGRPIEVLSGFRNDELNKLVGGSETSAHRYGLACDFRPPSHLTLFQAALLIAESGLIFDQLILEPTWIHIGLAPATKKQRQQVLTKFRGDPRYYTGLRKQP